METSQTLFLALKHEGRQSLPAAVRIGGRVIWVRAICLVTKADMSQSYVIMTFDGFETSVIKDFGSVSPIKRIEKVHPLLTLRNSDFPLFRTDQDVVSYLCQGGYDPTETERLIAEDPQEIKKRIFRTTALLAQDRGEFWAKFRRDKKKRPIRRGQGAKT